MIRTAVAIGALILWLGVPQPSVHAGEPESHPALDERVVARAIKKSPGDYVAAVVDLVSRCERRHESTCFDRVRIIDLVAQAPSPGPQRTVGDQFLLAGSESVDRQLPSPAPRYLVFAVPLAPSAGYHGYGAMLLSISPTAADVENLKKAIETVERRPGV